MKLSETQLVTLRNMLADGGHIWRLAGGYWVTRYVPIDQSGAPVGSCESAGTRTMEGLESRGLIERTNEFKESWRDTRKITESGRLAAASQKGEEGK